MKTKSGKIIRFTGEAKNIEKFLIQLAGDQVYDYTDYESYEDAISCIIANCSPVDENGNFRTEDDIRQEAEESLKQYTKKEIEAEIIAETAIGNWIIDRSYAEEIEADICIPDLIHIYQYDDEIVINTDYDTVEKKAITDYIANHCDMCENCKDRRCTECSVLKEIEKVVSKEIKTLTAADILTAAENGEQWPIDEECVFIVENNNF